jgi:hypothetical protein
MYRYARHVPSENAPRSTFASLGHAPSFAVFTSLLLSIRSQTQKGTVDTCKRDKAVDVVLLVVMPCGLIDRYNQRFRETVRIEAACFYAASQPRITSTASPP